MLANLSSSVLICLMVLGLVWSDAPTGPSNTKRDLKGAESASPILGSSWIGGNGGYRPPYYPNYPNYPGYPSYPGGYYPGSSGGYYPGSSGSYYPYPSWSNPNFGSSSGYPGGYGVYPGGYGNGYGGYGGYGGIGGYGGYGGYGGGYGGYGGYGNGYGNGWGNTGYGSYGTGYGTSGIGGYNPATSRNFYGQGYSNRSGYTTTKK